MKKEYLKRMSAEELDEYGALMGIEMRPAPSKTAKIALIEKNRDHEAVVTVLGMDMKIQKKSLYDKRVTDLLENPHRTDSETFEAMSLLLGDAQTELVMDACTDDDGTVDTAALGHAFARILTSEELKNS